MSEQMTPERCHIIEIMNDQDNKDISIARARVEPGVQTQLHALNDTDELYYILHGTGRIFLGTHQAEVSEGDCIRIRPGQSQSIVNEGKEDLIFLCICRPAFSSANYKNLET